jgi:hypothetical protein
MGQITDIPAFCERVFAEMRDGTYIKLIHGTSLRQSTEGGRWGPDGRLDDDSQDELDQVFASADDMAEELHDEALTYENSGKVYVLCFQRGKNAHAFKVVIDKWPSDDVEEKRSGRIARLAQHDPNAASSFALAQAFSSRNMQIDSVIRELRLALKAEQSARFAEVEAARRAGVAEFRLQYEATILETKARAARQVAMQQQLLTLVGASAPALIPMLAAKMGLGAVPPTPMPSPSSVDGDEQTVEEWCQTELTRIVNDLKAFASVPEGKAFIQANQATLLPELMALVA